MSIATAPPDTQALEVRSTDLTSRLAGLQIANVREVAPAVLVSSLEGSSMVARLADDYIREVKTGPPGTEGMGFDPMVSAANVSHKRLVAERDRLLAPAQKLKSEAGLLGHACNVELRRRQVELERQAREEQARQQAILDEAARIATEAARRAQDDATIEEGIRLAGLGDTEAANRLIAAPPVAPDRIPAVAFVPPPARITVETPGQSFSETWGYFEVVDEALIPREFWLLDRKTIRRLVSRMHERTNIPGIRVLDPRPKSTIRRLP